MKQFLIAIVCFWFFAISSLAQTSQIFDIATFQPPSVWKKQNKDEVIILDAKREQYEKHEAGLVSSPAPGSVVIV